MLQKPTFIKSFMNHPAPLQKFSEDCESITQSTGTANQYQLVDSWFGPCSTSRNHISCDVEGAGTDFTLIITSFLRRKGSTYGAS